MGAPPRPEAQRAAEFPWAAHYINIPPAEADCVKEVLSDLGIIEGYDEAGRPRIPEQHILRWPTERLFMDGRWTEWDLLAGASTQDREAILAFEDDMLTWTLYRGFDGRRAFSLPLSYSTADSRVRELDNISMETYVRSKGWNSPRLDLDDQPCLPGRLREHNGDRVGLGRNSLFRLPILRPAAVGPVPLRIR